jgi:uncharacterized membrane protein
MLRDKLMEHHQPVDGFRWRSHEITRIEGFSDAVFGFAITLLIVSLEVPRTSAELLETMRGFGAFVITFAMLARLWYAQYMFFRRYALEDRVTVILNLALLFTVLFFVYPLKFLFTNMIFDPLLKGRVMTAHGLEPVLRPEHRPWIYLVFGCGFAAVFGVFFLLYRHAYRQREELGLNEFEIYETRHSMRRMLMAVMVGMSYFALAGMQSLPQKTEGQKRVVVVVAIAVMLLFIGLFVTIARLARERRRTRKEWTSRQAPPPAGPPPPPDLTSE